MWTKAAPPNLILSLYCPPTPLRLPKLHPIGGIESRNLSPPAMRDCDWRGREGIGSFIGAGDKVRGLFVEFEQALFNLKPDKGENDPGMWMSEPNTTRIESGFEAPALNNGDGSDVE
ncbi:hypothetical protein ARALYDRAFT_913021 [Arabidopsis lyrata subsp. lyrata]|uniref:Uncharacterized protein n=1 Tax=Arabidopsis lyrata subsp. lyrata TaxID=81972 RepID=D7MGE5_ARALL|nr:hypothetical protein ARALYDRAFT_913021 [Arabidopsis lyrata subsp. lyrata]